MSLEFIESPTEQTTAGTDVVIAALALGSAAYLMRHRTWRAYVWGGAFSALAAAGVLGAATHGLKIGQRMHDLLWRLLAISFGLMVGCFASAATADGFGERAGRRVLPWLLLGAFGFDTVTRRLSRGFIVFIAYEAAALLYALTIYVRLAQGGRMRGAQMTAAGILLSLIAAAIQSSRLHTQIAGLPFDNNGIFHLVQIAAIPVLVGGIDAGLVEDHGA
ncbi:hypothetical protein EYB53_007215 [Candidatus Chloroploca sp. M-50]|uniref:Uncharacterized protein n=1 Tax=Candidatus Chloroploca mongolica TaxID=2528176 RepID=A0ABS4D7T7_9CHLR|nr:hypothetical protein [Candidatus Chloroploca mongolica]MBP1465491.1 hypothetical protein [Candidatus Chloroploca mongolica]